MMHDAYKPYLNEILEIAKKADISIFDLYASGHADAETFKILIDITTPAHLMPFITHLN